MTYIRPTQARALATEQKFLTALHELLLQRSFGQITIDAIAAQAGLERGAFLKRFGSKKQALLVLYERYCDKASVVMADIVGNLGRYETVEEACTFMSERLEDIQIADFPANRAMHEDFLENLRVHPLTRRIFLECVDMMRQVQRHLLQRAQPSEAGAFAAAQLLITINYNYVLKAMAALPADAKVRHRLIGRVVAQALEI